MQPSSAADMSVVPVMRSLILVQTIKPCVRGSETWEAANDC